MSQSNEIQEVTRYICPKCGTEYKTKQEAEACMNYKDNLAKRIEQLPPWHWYILESKRSTLRVAIISSKFGSEHGWGRNCASELLRMNDACIGYYYLSSDWEIVEGPVSLEEMWNKNRVAPDFISLLARSDMPDDVRQKVLALQERVKSQVYQDAQYLDDRTARKFCRDIAWEQVNKSTVRPYKGMPETLRAFQSGDGIDENYRKS